MQQSELTIATRADQGGQSQRLDKTCTCLIFIMIYMCGYSIFLVEAKSDKLHFHGSNTGKRKFNV